MTDITSVYYMALELQDLVNSLSARVQNLEHAKLDMQDRIEDLEQQVADMESNKNA